MVAKQQRPTEKKEFVPLGLADVWTAAPPVLDFVLPGLLTGTVGGVVAAGGTGKSIAMLTTALGIAIGRDIGDLWAHPVERGRAVYLSLEDPDLALRARLRGLASRLSSDELDLATTNLEVLSYAGDDVVLATSDKTAGVSTTPWFDALVDLLQKKQARLCVIDTFNRSIRGISEIDSDAMGSVIAKLERVARACKCAIVICHHVSKQAVSTASAGEAHAARGSSVITDNARWQCNLWVPSRRDKGFRNMSELERQAFVHLAVTKMNYGAGVEPRLLRRGEDGVLDYHGDLTSRATREAVSKSRLNSANTNRPARAAASPVLDADEPAKPNVRPRKQRLDPALRPGRRDPIEDLKSA